MSGEHAPLGAETSKYGGKYRPIATLGQGGMATVYLTVFQSAPGVNKLLVVKALKPELVSDSEFVAMFTDEARLAARLNHPNVVSTYEIGESPQGPFLVMEYLEGQALHAILPRVGRTKMPLAIHLWILSKALAGLHYAHELRDFDGSHLHVVHRDVSPQNVFVCYDGQVKLLDFGIAKASGSAARTETGVFKGKLGYISPEQITSPTVDHRADIFSVGVMMWEALTWRRLTAGDSEAVVLSKRTSGAFPRVREINPEVPVELARICEKAMSLSPEDRYPTAAAMQSALEEYMHGAQMRVTEREVGAVIAEAFSTERGKIRSAIETQLASATMSGSFPRQVLNLGSVAESTPPPPDVARPQPASVHPPADPSSFTVASFAGSNQLRAMAPWIAGGVIAALIGIVSGVVIVLNKRSGADPAASVQVTSASHTAPAQNEVPNIPSNINLDVRVQPPASRVSLDGSPMSGNPMRATVPRDGKEHKIRATAPGYLPEERAVTFDRDMQLDIVLRVAQGNFVPPPTTTDIAGTDLKKDPKPKHSIDEKDPYK